LVAQRLILARFSRSDSWYADRGSHRLEKRRLPGAIFPDEEGDRRRERQAFQTLNCSNREREAIRQAARWLFQLNAAQVDSRTIT
jgi:hypothetical protein